MRVLYKRKVLCFFLPNSWDMHIYMYTVRSCTAVSNVLLFRQI